jgi:hypothetical protein
MQESALACAPRHFTRVKGRPCIDQARADRCAARAARTGPKKMGAQNFYICTIYVLHQYLLYINADQANWYWSNMPTYEYLF